jgi:hypothetical protein
VYFDDVKIIEAQQDQRSMWTAKRLYSDYIPFLARLLYFRSHGRVANSALGYCGRWIRLRDFRPPPASETGERRGAMLLTHTTVLVLPYSFY